MGRIKTSSVKNIAKEMVEKHGDSFSTDFGKNKKALSHLVYFQSKRMRNIVAGYITTLKRASKQ